MKIFHTENYNICNKDSITILQNICNEIEVINYNERIIIPKKLKTVLLEKIKILKDTLDNSSELLMEGSNNV